MKENEKTWLEQKICIVFMKYTRKYTNTQMRVIFLYFEGQSIDKKRMRFYNKSIKSK